MLENSDTANVVSIFSRNRKVEEKPISVKAVASEVAAAPADLFDEIMRKNLEAQRKLADERNKANKAVLKSYRINQKD